MVEYERAFKHVDELETEAVRTLQKLLAIDTCVPPGRNYDKMVDYLENLFVDLGFNTERVTVPEEKLQEIPLDLEGPRENLVATKREGKEAVTIYAHMDTVPIDEAWSVDPFAGVVKDRRIYGRGTADMKGTIAGLVTALQVIRDLNLEPHCDPICVMCTDEEIGVYPGVYHLALNGYIEGHILCMEGSQDPVIGMGAAGTVDVRITSVGKSCHSGRNFMGTNAIEELIPIMNELMKLKTQVEKRESDIPSLAWNLKIPGAPSKKMTPMLNLDVIRGGTKANIVPSECTLTINRRYLVEEIQGDVVSEIEAAIERGKEKSEALDIKVHFSYLYPPYVMDPHSKYAKKMKEAYKVVQGYSDADFVEGGSGGSTDMAYVAQVLDTDKFVNCGAGRSVESHVHGADENIRIDDLMAHAKELVYYLCF